MTVFVATYRKFSPPARDVARTRANVKNSDILSRFLELYARPDVFLDWGDDPGFWSATTVFGDVRRASWGVCRRTLRASLSAGDVVVFFCAAPKVAVWDYHWIGFGTVKEVVSRADIWGSPDYAGYRTFLNVLAEPDGAGWAECESFFPKHKDWLQRLPNYVLFDPAPEASAFQIFGAPRVASYTDTVPEIWDDSPVARGIEDLLFERRPERRLRTSTTGYAHTHMRIEAEPVATMSMRSKLAALAAQHLVG